MCTEIMVSVSENPELKLKASMLIVWVSMNEIQSNVSTNQDQGVCNDRQMAKTSTV